VGRGENRVGVLVEIANRVQTRGWLGGEFHQILIRNNGREWQKNEGEYFPEWLREVAAALVEPIPHFDQVCRRWILEK
jgi:hypothetical protein